MDDNEQNSDIIKKSSFVLAFTILGMGAQYTLVSFATKVFSQSAFGQYSLAVSITTIVGVTGMLGLQVAEDRFIPIYRSNGELGKVRRFISVIFPVVFIISASLSALLYKFSDIISPLFGFSSFSSVIRLFSIAIIGLSILELSVYAYRGFEKPLPQAAFRRFGLPSLTLVICFSGYLAGMDVTSLYIAYPTAVVVLAIITIGVFYTQIFSSLPGSCSVDLKYIFDYSWPYSLNKMASVFLIYMDILFVGYFLTAQDVAIYQVVVVLSAFVLLPIRSLVPIYKPICSKQIATGKEGVSSIYNFIIRLSVIFGGVIIITYSVVGPDVLSLVSTAQYRIGGNALAVLALGNGIVLLFGPTGPTLQATDDSLVFLKVSLAKLSGNIILNIFLIPVYGIVGAAVATASSKFLGELMIYSHIRKVTPIHIESSQVLRLIVTFGLTYIVGILFQNIIEIVGHIGMITTIMVIGVVYVVCIYTFVLSEDDFALAKELFPEQIDKMIKKFAS